jgi:hypothetical protein
LTVDTEDNGNASALTVNATAASSLTVILGNAVTGAGGILGDITATDENAFAIMSQGTGANFNDTGFVLLTPTSAIGVTEAVTIGGTQDITIGSAAGAIANAIGSPLALADNMTLTVTDTGVVTLDGATAAGLLDFASVATATIVPYSVNANTITATNSGGLIMTAGDATFTGATGTTGDMINGSTTAGNVLGGSLGNDTIVGTLSLAAPDTIYTNGGADTITLATGHTAVDHIGLYVGATTAGVTPGAVEDGLGSSIVQAGDIAQPGFWGQAPLAAPAVVATTAAGAPFTSDASTVGGFVPSTTTHQGDVIDLSVGAWSGLLLNVSTGAALAGTAAGTAATFTSPTATGTAVATAGEVLVVAGFTGTAATLAPTLASAAGAISGITVPVGFDHFIVAYQGTTGVTVADLDIHATAASASTATSATQTLALSDMVTLPGVTLPHLLANDVHFIT